MARPSRPVVILITGATGSLGTALARAYAAPGRTLVLHGRDPDRLGALQCECEARGARVAPCVLDLGDPEAVRARFGTLAEDYAIDLAILNAGMTSNLTGSPDGESWHSIERVMAVNARSAMAAITALLPAMRRRRRGQIALISSLSAWYGLGLTPAYCASKAALKAYGEALGAWLAPDGIAVTVVLPGFIASAMSEQFPGPRPFLITAERAAARIRRGLELGQARISFPQPLAFGTWCLALLPAGWSRRILNRLGYSGPRQGGGP